MADIAGPPAELHCLAQGVYAWLAAEPGHGHPNAGAVIDVDGVTVIDTLCVPSQYSRFAATVDGWGLRVPRVVLTGDHIEQVGGTVGFKMSAIYGSPAASAHLDQPPNPAVYRRLHPSLADEFDDEMRTRPVSHVVTDAVELTPAVAVIPTAGQSGTNLVVLVPDSDILFTGAMGCFGVTPLAFDGDPGGWADALDRLADLAGTIVPGHGPVGGLDELRAQQAYLRACVAADGDPAAIGSGPWERWPGRRWDEVNVERAAMLAADHTEVPPSMLRAVGLA